MNVHDGVGQIQRDAVILQALDDIAVEAAGIGHELHAGQHLRPLQRHAPGHDEADVPAAQDHHPAAGHVALQVHEFLGGAGAVNAGAAGAGDGQRPPGPLPAAHGQHHGLRLKHLQSVFPAHGGDAPVPAHGQHRYPGADVDPHFPGGVDVPPGVLGAGQFLLEAVQPEAVVDALAQDAPGLILPLQHDQAVNALLFRGDGGGQARRARADHQYVHPDRVFTHGPGPPLRCPSASRPAGGFPRRIW